MKELLDLGQMLSVHARLSRDRLGARDLDRSLTFGQWNERSCRLANALLGIGLSKAIASRCWPITVSSGCEIYAAAAKAGRDRRADQLPSGRA